MLQIKPSPMGPIESHTHPSHVTITTQSNAANRARKMRKSPRRHRVALHWVGERASSKPPPKLIDPPASLLWRPCACGGRRSPTFCPCTAHRLCVCARKGGAERSIASSTVVIVSVSVPELKSRGGWATRAGGSKLAHCRTSPKGHLNAVNRKMAFCAPSLRRGAHLMADRHMAIQ